MKECIFCKIIRKDIKTKILFEDNDIIAFNDVSPIAPIHVLIIPKKHIASIDDLEENDTLLAGKLIQTAKKLSRDLGIAKKGYKLLFRVKEEGGQEVDHIHLHLIGGVKLYEEIRPA